MVYCRGCGQQIHETAIQCPKCGAPQAMLESKVPRGKESVRGESINYFLIVPMVLFSIVDLISSSKYKNYGNEDYKGAIILATVIIILSFIHLQNYSGGKKLSITSFAFAIFAIFASLMHMK